MVSVVIPAYNREKVVKQAIESVLNQTYKDIEVIVVDDGSTDTTADIVKSMDDARLNYVYQKNQGACVARNHGIDEAKGEYIAFHDSDDFWKPDKLEKQMTKLEQTNADLVFCKLIKHMEGGREEIKPGYIKEGFLEPVVNLFGIGTQTIVGKRKIFEEYQFDREFPRFQELELLYRIAEKYRIYCVDEGLVDYYVGEDSISANPDKQCIACELLLKKHPELPTKYPVMSDWVANLLLNAGYQVRQKNRAGDYAKYLNLSKRYCGKSAYLVKGWMIRTGIYGVLKSIKR